MKRVTLVATIVLLGATVVFAQATDGGIDIEQKQTRHLGAGGGERAQPRTMYGGVYLMVPNRHTPEAGNPSALLTFNGDRCADATPLWDGVLGSETGVNGTPHGTWRYEGATRISANLYYFTETRAGALDRVGRATLTVDLGEDLTGGPGVIVFESYLPGQIPAAFEDNSGEEAIGGRLTMEVRLIRLR